MKKRPEILNGSTYKHKTACGNLYVIVNKDEFDDISEVFIQNGKAGGCAASQCESTGRLINYSLKTGGTIGEIVKQLKGITCHQKTPDALSCSDAIARILERESTKEKCEANPKKVHGLDAVQKTESK